MTRAVRRIRNLPWVASDCERTRLASDNEAFRPRGPVASGTPFNSGNIIRNNGLSQTGTAEASRRRYAPRPPATPPCPNTAATPLVTRASSAISASRLAFLAASKLA